MLRTALHWLGISPAIFVLSCAVSLPQAHAFPENVRHGYPNCSSCHINPNGQGLLNDYGRELSKAVQSYGKFFFEPSTPPGKQAADAEGAEDSETQFLYGYVAHPKWLALGGDLRFLQLFQNTPSLTQAQFITMQMDAEAAVTVGKITIDGTVGYVNPSYVGNTNPGFWDWWVSRRHYILLQATDEFFVMGGRFWKPYGILDPNHSSAVKEYLNWNFGSESYNIEMGYQTSHFSLVGYADLGRPDSSAEIEKGGGGTASVDFADRFKVGASYFYGYNDLWSRHVFGPWAILGFTEHFYLNTENDFVITTPTGASTISGFATYNRLGYEWVQGVHTYLEQGFNQQDLFQQAANQVSNPIQIYGVGALYYPRPHWEFEADYQKRKYGESPASQGFFDYLYFQLHYYL